MGSSVQKIKEVISAYQRAVKNKDVDGFMALYADDLIVYDTWDKWTYEGLEPLRAMVVDWFSSLGDENVTAETSELKIIEGGKLSTAHAIVRFTAFSAEGKELRHLYNRFTWVMKKSGEEWQIVHEHSSSPIGSEGLKAKLER